MTDRWSWDVPSVRSPPSHETARGVRAHGSIASGPLWERCGWSLTGSRSGTESGPYRRFSRLTGMVDDVPAPDSGRDHPAAARARRGPHAQVAPRWWGSRNPICHRSSGNCGRRVSRTGGDRRAPDTSADLLDRAGPAGPTPWVRRWWPRSVATSDLTKAQRPRSRKCYETFRDVTIAKRRTGPTTGAVIRAGDPSEASSGVRPTAGPQARAAVAAALRPARGWSGRPRRWHPVNWRPRDRTVAVEDRGQRLLVGVEQVGCRSASRHRGSPLKLCTRRGSRRRTW